MKYVLGIDQSTQGTKAVLFDEAGKIAARADHAHRQWVNELGWVSHDAAEIYQNVIRVSRDAAEYAGVNKDDIAAIGISNQRETTVAWDRDGNPIDKAIVWQCARAKEITDEQKAHAELIREKTGLPLSPYWPAGKMAWLVKHVIADQRYFLGTVDSWLVYKLTGGKSFKCDYSNASRTQLFNLHTLQWDAELCGIFGIPMISLPEVCDSNSLFGCTDLEGFLNTEIPIRGVLGDSHGALFGQGCHREGMIKVTYGTGSSIMMNVGEGFAASKNGLATSLAWGIDGRVSYVLEGNINYAGAVITWLQEDVKLLDSPKEISDALRAANPADTSVLVPAFTGLGAPYWNSGAKAMLCGMTRSTGRNEIIKAAEESIAFQINDVLQAMKNDSGILIKELYADGGPAKDTYLMQFQSDISDMKVGIRREEELSVMGAAYLAGIAQGVYRAEELFGSMERVYYAPKMPQARKAEKLRRWQEAVQMVASMYGKG
ncbi:MAG: glycerol kinase GlpK [Clostridiales bacterium]|jgi:glycerol kinase|nr:glycerol kinase GlpK [Clostridiales bacterium]